jgi:hypothetical protein
MTKSRKRKARTNKIKRRATLKPYRRELERAAVPPSVVAEAMTAIAILLAAGR